VKLLEEEGLKLIFTYGIELLWISDATGSNKIQEKKGHVVKMYCSILGHNSINENVQRDAFNCHICLTAVVRIDPETCLEHLSSLQSMRHGLTLDIPPKRYSHNPSAEGINNFEHDYNPGKACNSLAPLRKQKI
jgi:hypothetical protein